MKAIIAVLVAFFALLGLPAAAATPTRPPPAVTQCNCPSASLLNTPVSATYSTASGSTPTVNWNASMLMDQPSAGPVFGMGGWGGRLNIDLGPNTIQLFFIDQPQTYAPGTKFTFTNLFPKVQSGWPGSCTAVPEITHMTVQTKASAATFMTANTSFTPHSVSIPISGQWNPGDSILVTFSFNCPPAVVSPCCPPWNAATLKATLSYQGTGGIGSLYHLKFTPTPLLSSQMDAYFLYLKSLNPNIAWYGIEFALYNGGIGNVSVPSATPLWATNHGPSSPWTFFPLGLNANQWYRVRTKVYYWLVGGGMYQPPNCPDAFIDIRVQVP